MSSARRYLSFFGLALALGIAPGPDVLFVFAQSVASGAIAGVCVTLGLCTGLCVHVALATFGFAAVMRKHPNAFKAITWCGAAYLLWLGIGAWQSANVPAEEAAALALPPLRLWARGVVMNLCNPKVILFFLALVPRFVDREKGREALQFLQLGALFALATLIVFSSVGCLGGALASIFSADSPATPWLRRGSAVVMFALAAWIAWMNLKSGENESGERRAESGEVSPRQ